MNISDVLTPIRATGRTAGMKPEANMIRRRRKALGWTQAQLAELVGMSEGHLSQIETGERTGSHETRRAIADALGCGLDDLEFSADSVEGLSRVSQERYRVPIVARIEHGEADEVVVESSAAVTEYLTVSDKPAKGEVVYRLDVDAPRLGWRAGDLVRVVPATEAPSGSVVIVQCASGKPDAPTMRSVKVYFERGGMRMLAPLDPSRHRPTTMGSRWQIVGLVKRAEMSDLQGRFEGLADEMLGG